MYGVFRDVIARGEYELASLLKKVKKTWAEDELTDGQRDELLALARENAKPENSYASLENQVQALFQNMGEMGLTIRDILTRLTVLEGGETESEEPTEEVEEYPPYVQPLGAHDAYKTGDKITYNGKKYVCLSDGCVWTPEAYPQGWQEVTEQEVVEETE